MRALSGITVPAALILPTGAFAEVQTITATHTYLLFALHLNRLWSEDGSGGWGFKSLRAHHFPLS